jgi:hypothetical protein
LREYIDGNIEAHIFYLFAGSENKNSIEGWKPFLFVISGVKQLYEGWYLTDIPFFF